MTLHEQLYQFNTLDTHSAITLQLALETRKMNITSQGSELMKKGDKVLKAVIEEIDQMYDDLDRHISAGIRREELAERARNEETKLQSR